MVCSNSINALIWLPIQLYFIAWENCLALIMNFFFLFIATCIFCNRNLHIVIWNWEFNLEIFFFLDNWNNFSWYYLDNKENGLKCVEIAKTYVLFSWKMLKILWDFSFKVLIIIKILHLYTWNIFFPSEIHKDKSL